MDFPNWTAEKLYRVNKVLNEYDVPPLEYLRVLLTSLRLGRKMGVWLAADETRYGSRRRSGSGVFQDCAFISVSV